MRTISLLGILASLGCVPPPSSTADPVGHQASVGIEAIPAVSDASVASTSVRLGIETGDEGRMVTLSGLPAIRGDGRVVMVLEEVDDSSVDLVLLDTQTGSERDRWPLPEHVTTTEAGDVEREIDTAALDALNQRISAAGFVPLPRLQVEHEATEEGDPTRFAGQGLRVAAQTRYDDEGARSTVTIADQRGHELATHSDDADTVSVVSVAPNGAFVVLTESFCACECSWWSVLYPLHRA